MVESALLAWRTIRCWRFLAWRTRTPRGYAKSHRGRKLRNLYRYCCTSITKSTGSPRSHGPWGAPQWAILCTFPAWRSCIYRCSPLSSFSLRCFPTCRRFTNRSTLHQDSLFLTFCLWFCSSRKLNLYLTYLLKVRNSYSCWWLSRSFNTFPCLVFPIYSERIMPWVSGSTTCQRLVCQSNYCQRNWTSCEPIQAANQSY